MSHLKPLQRIFFGRHSKISYSQCGEDLIISSIFDSLGIRKPSYIDIGAHDPAYLSNTYLLYLKGSRGVCIEPNPILYANIRKKRKKDICLNVGVGITTAREADFYCMTSSTLSTFSKEDAERMVGYGNEKIEKIITIPLITFNDIISNHLLSSPNFVSVDVEGMDLAILKSIDLAKYRPQVFCVETLTYTENKTEQKILPTIKFMLDNGYFVYGDTFVNTIFVDNEAWRNRKNF